MDKDTIKWGSKLILIGSINISIWFVFLDIPFHFFVAGITFCLGGVLFFSDGNIMGREKLIFYSLVSILILIELYCLSSYFVFAQSSSFFTKDLKMLIIGSILISPILFCWLMLIRSSDQFFATIKPMWIYALRTTAGVYSIPALLAITFFIAYMLGFKGEFNFQIGIKGDMNEGNIIFYYFIRALFLAPLGYLNYVLLRLAKIQLSIAP